VNTEKALRDRIKNDRRQFVTHRKRIYELDKELRETRDLVVALITSNGAISVDGSGARTFELFLDDRDIANVAHDDMLVVAYDNRRGGSVYTVTR